MSFISHIESQDLRDVLAFALKAPQGILVGRKEVPEFIITPVSDGFSEFTEIAQTQAFAFLKSEPDIYTEKDGVMLYEED